MDIGKSIGYVFEDKKWTNKILLGVLVSVIPIVNFAYLGYLTVIMKNVTERVAQPLPDWNEFGDKFVKGLILTVSLFIYSLPALLLLCPFAFLPFMRSAGEDSGRAVAGLFVGTTLLITCVMSIYGLIISFLMPAINLNFARKNTFGSCFEFGEIWRIMSHNLGDYIVAWLITIVIATAAIFVMGLVAGVLAFIPCCGWIAAWVLLAGTGVWIGAVYAHLFGQIGTPSLPPSDQLIIPSV